MTGITDDILSEVRKNTDIVKLVRSHKIPLLGSGHTFRGRCPFHKEKGRSFVVDRKKGLYHCFGCGAGGDVIHFVRQIDRLDFRGAVHALRVAHGIANL